MVLNTRPYLYEIRIYNILPYLNISKRGCQEKLNFCTQAIEDDDDEKVLKHWLRYAADLECGRKRHAEKKKLMPELKLMRKTEINNTINIPFQ